MKIAKEIVRSLELEMCLLTRTAESIIAAKLRPIRNALHMVWDNPEEMAPSDMVKQYNDAIELLEENDE